MLTPMLERMIEVPYKVRKSKIRTMLPKRTARQVQKDVRCSLLNNGEFGLKWLVPGGYMGDPMVFWLSHSSWCIKDSKEARIWMKHATVTYAR